MQIKNSESKKIDSGNFGRKLKMKEKGKPSNLGTKECSKCFTNMNFFGSQTLNLSIVFVDIILLTGGVFF